MISKHFSVILCSIIVLCLTKDFTVKCDGDWKPMVDFGTSVDHDAMHGHENDQVKHHSVLSTENHDDGHQIESSGLENGNHELDKGTYDKNVQESGKYGKDDDEKHTDQDDDQHKKHSTDDHGEKWSLTDAGYKEHDADEWKDKENGNRHKGNGFVQKADWEEERGEKGAYGKKSTDADQYHKTSHKEKDLLKQYQGVTANKSGSKKTNYGTNLKDHGKKNKKTGKKREKTGKKDEKTGKKDKDKSWKEKRLEYEEYQKKLEKILAKKSRQHEQGNDDDQGGYEQHDNEEE